MKIILTVTIFLTVLISKIEAKIRHYNLFELIENSKTILLVELLKTTEYYTIENEEILPSSITLPRYAHYKVLNIIKGDFKKTTLVLDYKVTNEIYKPFICRPIASPIDCEIVILFLEEENLLFAGFQGKQVLEKEQVESYTNCLKNIIAINKLNNQHERDISLLALYNKNNKVQKSILKNAIAESWDLSRPIFGPFLESILKNKTEDSILRYRAARKLGDLKDNKYLEVFTQSLTDPDLTVRKVSIEALGEYKSQKAIQILKEYIKNEKWDIGKKYANSIILQFERELTPKN